MDRASNVQITKLYNPQQADVVDVHPFLRADVAQALFDFVFGWVAKLVFSVHRCGHLFFIRSVAYTNHRMHIVGLLFHDVKELVQPAFVPTRHPINLVHNDAHRLLLVFLLHHIDTVVVQHLVQNILHTFFTPHFP